MRRVISRDGRDVMSPGGIVCGFKILKMGFVMNVMVERRSSICTRRIRVIDFGKIVYILCI